MKTHKSKAQGNYSTQFKSQQSTETHGQIRAAWREQAVKLHWKYRAICTIIRCVKYSDSHSSSNGTELKENKRYISVVVDQ